eukprot:15300012-Ditylum_brightwellii.AAC.1
MMLNMIQKKQKQKQKQEGSNIFFFNNRLVKRPGWSDCTNNCARTKFYSQKGQERYFSGLGKYKTKQNNHPQQEISEESKVNGTEDSKRKRQSSRITLRKQ